MNGELSGDSIAGIVLAADRAADRARRRARGRGLQPAFVEDGPAAIILGGERARARRRSALTGAIALAAAAVVHAGAWATLSTTARGGERAPVVSAAIHVEHIVDIPLPELPRPSPAEPASPAEPPEPAVEPESEPATPEPTPALAPPAPAPRSVPARTASAAAAAGNAITSAPADDTLDLASDGIVVGPGSGYTGGVTAPTGTHTRAVHAAPVRSPPAGLRGGVHRGADSARPVGLGASDWRCAWPRTADALSIDEQIVVLRVDVSADGTVTSARVVSDPGYGFGGAARACARRHRFEPATDRSGRAVAATSPPIRVTFTR